MRGFWASLAAFVVLALVFAISGQAYGTSGTNVIGYSGKGREIVAVEIAPDNWAKTAVIITGIHGFEDCWPRDGEELVKIAKSIIKYYQDSPEKLQGHRLIVVPLANPDGLAEGWTNNGPGRCQVSLGIDINKDFDFNFMPVKNPRTKTANKPFASPEAQALRELVLSAKPDILIDIHGWLGYTKGDLDLAEYFNNALGIQYNFRLPKGFLPGQGQLITWANSLGIRTLLLELPDPATGQGKGKKYGTKPKYVKTEKFALKIIQALDSYFTDNCIKDFPQISNEGSDLAGAEQSIELQQPESMSGDVY